MSKTSNYVRTICEIGLFAAIGFVLDELQGILSKGIFPVGGSIGFALIAVVIIGYRRGWFEAILTGLLMGILDIMTSAYIVHPFQLFLDYIFPYALVGVGCLFKMPFDKTDSKKGKIFWLLMGVLVGGLLKFTSHYLSGVIFFANPSGFAWGLNNLNPFVYSFIYNIAFIGPSIILSGILVAILFLRVPSIFSTTSLEKEESKDSNVYPLAFSITTILGGTFCFVWYLIKYIASFSSYKDGNASGYDFDPDAMILFVLGLFVAIVGINALIAFLKKKSKPLVSATALLIIVSSSFIYGVARLIRMYVKQKDPTIYWIWFGVGLFTVLVVAGLEVYLFLMKRKETPELKEANQ